MTDLMAAGNITIQKANFLPLHTKAREQAYTMNNIISAFRTCGIVPLNSHIVLSELEPPTEPTAQARLPPTPNNGSSLLRQARQVRLQLRAQQEVNPLQKDILSLLDPPTTTTTGRFFRTNFRSRGSPNINNIYSESSDHAEEQYRKSTSGPAKDRTV